MNHTTATVLYDQLIVYYTFIAKLPICKSILRLFYLAGASGFVMTLLIEIMSSVAFVMV